MDPSLWAIGPHPGWLCADIKRRPDNTCPPCGPGQGPARLPVVMRSAANPGADNEGSSLMSLLLLSMIVSGGHLGHPLPQTDTRLRPVCDRRCSGGWPWHRRKAPMKVAVSSMKPMAVALSTALALTLLSAGGASADEIQVQSSEASDTANVGSTAGEDTVMLLSEQVIGVPDVDSASEPVLVLPPGHKDQEHTDAVPAVVVAAAAWCARGAIASVPTTVLTDILAGKASSRKTYVTNAVVGCFVGELGGVAWRVVPGWAKEKAIHAAIALLIRWRA